MELENVAEFTLLVTFWTCSIFSGYAFDQIHGGVNRLSIFTWRFLLNKFADDVANPPLFFFDMMKNCFGVHAWML